MSDAIIVFTILLAAGVVLLAIAPQASDKLVRARARGLPLQLALRMEEEWRGELNAITSRLGKLAFAIALVLTRRRSFVAPGEDVLTAVSERSAGGFGILGGWKSLLIFPTLIFGIAAYAGSFLLPAKYASSALLIVRLPAIPENVVPRISEPPLDERLKAHREVLLSRSNLRRILNNVRLYESLEMEAKIEKLRENVSIELLPSRITLTFVGPDQESAQAVAKALTENFVSLHLMGRQEKINGVRLFLESYLQELTERLIVAGESLARERAVKGIAVDVKSALEYEGLQKAYATTVAKQEELRMVEARDTWQRGEVMMIQDPAHRPLHPMAENRLGIAAMGASAGFALGGLATIGLYRRQRRLLA